MPFLKGKKERREGGKKGGEEKRKKKGAGRRRKGSRKEERRKGRQTLNKDLSEVLGYRLPIFALSIWTSSSGAD